MLAEVRPGLEFKAHRLVYHSTVGLRVMKKQKKYELAGSVSHSFVSSICRDWKSIPIEFGANLSTL